MEESGMVTLPAGRTAERTERERPWLWNVVLFDSDDHTYEYVIEMLTKVFGFPEQRGYGLAEEIDSLGRGIALTTHREHAELKAEQVRAYGPDRRVAGCSTALRVSLEPVPAE